MDQEKVNKIIMWLTGYTKADIINYEQHDISYGEFFRQSPQLNPARKRITGSICGSKVEREQAL